MNSASCRRPFTLVISTPTEGNLLGELLFDLGEEGVEKSFEGVAVEADFLALLEAQHSGLGIELDPSWDRHHRTVLGHRSGEHPHLVQRIAVTPFDLRVAQ